MQKERKKEGRSHLEEVVYFRRGVCTTIIQHPFTRGGPHTLWGSSIVKGYCMIVVHLVYNYHYSFSTGLCFGKPR
jgi:hypothetical protein